jgi:hypothetical protein
MVRAKIRKTLYWHPLAKVLLEHGLMPKHCADAIKGVYPQADITGRHIGAYKRRLIMDDMLDKDTPKTLSPNEAYAMIEGMVGEDDKFIYDCTIGSAKRTMKCFEYKLSGEIVDHNAEVEEWITQIQA